MDGTPLALSSAQAKDISLLHQEFRNDFAHFIPKSWSIENAGLPRMILTAVDAVEMLMGHTRIARKLSGNRTRRLAKRVKAVRAELSYPALLLAGPASFS